MNAPAILPTEKPKVQRLTYDEQDLVLLLLKHARTRYTAPDENYLKGLQGLHAADDALKKNNAHGLLIGGLGKSVWMWAKRNTNYLLTHSNVDVAVLDYSYQPTKNERGINWWNLKHANIKLHPHIASKFESVPYWTNYNNSPLTFGPRGELFQ